MPGPPRKPCFQPPVARSSQEKPPERGQPGWLEALAKDLENEKPKAGEDGWLVSMAKDMEEELRPSGDTMISNSGDLSSRRSSQGASSQGSQGNSNRIGGSSGETSGTLRNVSGGQTSSQTFSQKLSQSEDNKSSQSQTKVSQSEENSQPSSQPSSIDVLATQAVSSQLYALAAADSQASQNGSQDVSVDDAADVGFEVSSAAVAVPISQDIFLSPEEPVATSAAVSGLSEPQGAPQPQEESASTEEIFTPSGLTEPASKDKEDIVSTAASNVVGAITEQSECAEIASKKSSSNDEELENDVGDEEGISESSDEEVDQSGDPASKTPDVPRLVVPGLLGSVLEKIGQNKTSPLKTSEPMVQGLLGAVLEKIGKGETPRLKPVKKPTSKGIEKSRNGNDVKKPNVAKKTATPKAFPSLARKSLAGSGKIAKRPKKRKLPKKAVVSQLNAARGNAGFSQISAASALLDLQKLRTAGTWVRCSLQHCGKWRKLQEKDPSQVVSKWECRKNPDVDYSQCSTPEQRWSPGPEWVQNRFTVGSLVYAQIQGFPAWPAMVDDDPDTGSFFWTGVDENGEWELRPSHYHVVFFDQRGVSRAWVLDGKLTCFTGLSASLTKEMKNNGRLMKAVHLAEEAMKEDLMQRRRNYCLAARYKGVWGPAWPGCDEERRLFVGGSWERVGEEGAALVESRRHETMSAGTCTSDTSMEENDQSTSMEEDDLEESEDVQMKELLGNKKGDVEEAVSQLMPTDVEEIVSSSDSKIAGALQPGERLAALWEDRSLFTQEFSDRTLAEKQSSRGKDVSEVAGPRSEANLSTNASGGLQQVCASSLETSFHSGVGGDEAGPSQELQAALEIAEAITPVKPRTLSSKPSTPLVDLPKIKIPSTPTHGLTPTTMATSTPGRSTREVEGVSDLNNTVGSNAFSADGSFIDL